MTEIIMLIKANKQKLNQKNSLEGTVTSTEMPTKIKLRL